MCRLGYCAGLRLKKNNNAVPQVKCCVIPAQKKDLRDQRKSNAAHRAFVIDGLCLCNSWLSNMYISLIHKPKGMHVSYSELNVCATICNEEEEHIRPILVAPFDEGP